MKILITLAISLAATSSLKAENWISLQTTSPNDPLIIDKDSIIKGKNVGYYKQKIIYPDASFYSVESFEHNCLDQKRRSHIRELYSITNEKLVTTEEYYPNWQVYLPNDHNMLKLEKIICV